MLIDFGIENKLELELLGVNNRGKRLVNYLLFVSALVIDRGQ